jgi:hypothetical protein
VRKVFRIKISVQFMVDARQKIQIKSGGHAPRVVISLKNRARVFLQIKPDKQNVACVHQRP